MSYRSYAIAKVRWSLVDTPTDWLKAIEQGEVTPAQWEMFSQKAPDELKDLAHLASGLGWFRLGLYYRAIQAFKRAGHSKNPLRDVQLFFWAESLFHQGLYQESQEKFLLLQREQSGSLWSHRARFRLADLQQALGDLQGAVNKISELLSRYSEYPYQKSIQLQAAENALRVGDLEATQAWLNIMTPGSLQDISVRRSELLRIQKKMISSEKSEDRTRLQRVVQWRRWKNYERALFEVRELLKVRTPKDRLWSEIALEEIRILNKMERFQDALDANDRFDKKNREARWVRTNRWWRSEALFRVHRVADAAKEFKRSRISPTSPGNLARLGMIYFNGGLYQKAEDAFKEASSRGEKGDPDLYMARRLVRWLPYRLGRYREAASKFRNMSRGGRGRNHYAHYWWARSLQKLNREEEALKVYQQLIKRAPYSFYAYLAQMRLKEAGIIAEVPWTSQRSPTLKMPIIKPLPNALDSLRPLVQKQGEYLSLWEAIYGLTLIGEKKWAMIYLRALTEENRSYFNSSGSRRYKWSFNPRFYFDNRDDVDYGVWGEQDAQRAPRSREWAKGLARLRPSVLRSELIDVYRALGDHYYGRRVSYYKGPSLTYPERVDEAPEWQRRYPRSFQNAVESSAARYQIDPHLIWALMTVESSHNPWAISRVGARGLMQVMPHTGQLSADRLGWAYFGSPLLFEPEIAIEMAAWYFQQLTDEFHGQLPLAMAAYNAGPHRVKVWLQFKGDLPLDELIEEIPYAQAREYAKKVTRHLGLYRRIYEGYTGHLFDLKVNPYPRNTINF